MSDTRYIVGLEQTYGTRTAKGWLLVKMESGEIESVCEHLQVKLIKEVDRREYFEFLDGPYRGRKASVKKPSGSSYLTSTDPGLAGAARVSFKISTGIVKWPGGTVSATTDASNLPPTGTHALQLPDFPHDLAKRYLADTPYALHWFYIGKGHAKRGNDRYLHMGSISAGCTTVTDGSGWTRLYQYLVLSRADDHSAGKIEIKT